MKFTAYLNDGSKKIVEGMNEWQAFFCLNVDHPGDVAAMVCETKADDTDQLPEFLKPQGF